MKEKALTVEFRLPPTGTSPAPKPPPGARAERQRQERAARKARNLALAHYIDSLVRSGEVRDLAAVARMCGVSRARVSRVVGLLEATGQVPWGTLGSTLPRKKQCLAASSGRAASRRSGC